MAAKIPLPPKTPMPGRLGWNILSQTAHAPAGFEAYSHDTENRGWTYLPYGPFEEFEGLADWLNNVLKADDPLFHAIVDLETRDAVGVASYLRIDPPIGVIEVGHIHFSPLMKQTPIATEAMFLMMQRAFDELGYRRYEWKCDNADKLQKRRKD
ncbi:MAG: GNAT family N-acetyltransferase [Arenicellales bacterium WSBS_2016_MAG_OTU3]